MKQIINISIERIKPNPGGVFQSQGIPPEASPPKRVKELYDSAEVLFFKLAAPIGIIADISIEEFAKIYAGNGNNEPDTPLEHIFPRANHLALFAFTLGKEISREIQQQLKDKNLAKGYMLDTVASYCTDKASEIAQTFFHDQLVSKHQLNEANRVLLYSPGYCGWHVSGQKKLFAYLKPEEIGIHLNESFLMIPLKSISGVLVSGDLHIHQFVNNYPFCTNCQTHNCRDRIKRTRKSSG
jgi:hypothetical protein